MPNKPLLCAGSRSEQVRRSLFHLPPSGFPSSPSGSESILFSLLSKPCSSWNRQPNPPTSLRTPPRHQGPLQGPSISFHLVTSLILERKRSGCVCVWFFVFYFSWVEWNSLIRAEVRGPHFFSSSYCLVEFHNSQNITAKGNLWHWLIKPILLLEEAEA